MSEQIFQPFRELNDLELTRMTTLRQKARELWNVIDQLPPSRETSLAKTKVEEAVLWAGKAITA